MYIVFMILAIVFAIATFMVDRMSPNVLGFLTSELGRGTWASIGVVTCLAIEAVYIFV